MAAPVSATNAKGTSLNDCTTANWGGGIKLFDGLNQGGTEDRVMCGQWQSYDEDTHLGSFDASDGVLADIGNCNNDALSYRLRAKSGCKTTVSFFGKTAFGNYWLKKKLDRTNDSTITKSYNLPQAGLSSIKLWVTCSGG